MTEIDRAIGRLEGKVDGLVCDVAELKQDVKALQRPRSSKKKWAFLGVMFAAILDGISRFFNR